MKIFARVMFFLTAAVVCSAKPSPIVYLPKEGGSQLKVAVWLHGYRGYPSVIQETYFQTFADNLKIVIVGFPATTDLGDGTQQWSEEPAADHAYIQERLAALAQKHDIDRTRVALFGFSQGAMVAADLFLLCQIPKAHNFQTRYQKPYPQITEKRAANHKEP